MPLPPFEPPTLAELREWYRRYGKNDDIWRLILEVQHSRELLAHLRWQLDKADRIAEWAEFGRLSGKAAPLRAALDTICAEMRRIGPIGGKGKPEHWRPTPRSTDDMAAYDYDPDAPSDHAALVAARRHGRRR
ncbi:hypothetical protein [Paraburkholderia susongensis]|uniref:Uncharacterized protein n=1 Tax=Paraburkholderia susongensis TaxID=1515439 RepID=A0A1X7I3X9_9BURK|nr:hypothetical protein [Paraburkholderia susongensis]SMG09118.1 hypothetical protein SAMN06265784_101305 [Paraburkholderia susongensis]